MPTSNINFDGDLSRNNRQFKLVVENHVGTATSNTAIVAVYLPVSITANPQNVDAFPGDKISFSVSAVNATNYTWQVSTDNGGSWATTGVDSSTLYVSVTSSMEGWRWRCIAWNPASSATSDWATLGTSAYSIWSVSRKVRPLYSGAVLRARRSTDNAEQDFFGTGPDGEVSTSELRTFNGWNLCAGTEDFGGSAWNRNAGISIENDAATAPNGTLTADRINGFNSAGGDRITQLIPFSGAKTVTASIWVKGEGENIGKFVRLQFKRSLGTLVSTTLDHALTGDWTRISVTGTTASDTSGLIFVLVATGANPASSFLAWGAQLEISQSVTDYEPRTTTRAADSFLVTLYEQAEDGKNLLARTEEFGDSYWTKVAVSLSNDAAASPNGDMTAESVVETVASSAHQVYRAISVVENETYTWSVYVKSNGRQYCWLNAFDNNDRRSFYDLSGAGTVLSSATGNTAAIQNVGNGWYRISITRTSVATNNTAYFAVGTSSDGVLASFAGDGVSGLFVWGAQLETGSSATWYERRTTHGAGTRLNFTQSTTTLQPIICEQGVPVVKGNRLAAKFVAADARRMAVASSTSFYNFMHTTGGSVAAISQANDTASIKVIVGNHAGAAANGFRYGYNGTENVIGIVGNNTVQIMNGFSSTDVLNNVLSVSYIDPDSETTATRFNVWLNGANSLVTPNGLTGAVDTGNATNDITLGARGAAVDYFDGTISEVVIFDRLISSEARVTYTTTAGAFHGITVSQPVSITQQPQNIFSYAGDTVTFSVTAPNATDYAWEVSTNFGSSWSAVGFNRSSLDVAVTSDKEGWLYRCTASNSTSSAVSSSAVLSVTTSIWSVSRKIRPTYSGPIIRLRRSTDNTEQDFSGTGVNGEVSATDIRTFNGWNLFARTSEFTNAAWVKTDGSLAVTALDGQTDAFSGSTASLMTPAAGTGSSFFSQNQQYVSGLTYTISFDAKANGCNFVQVAGSTGFSTGDWRNFNLTDGTVGNGNGTSNYSVTSLGSGWYRISMSFVCNTSIAASRIIIAIFKTDVASRLATTDTFNGTDGIFIARPQIEVASSFSTYEPRTTTGAGSSFLVTLYSQTTSDRNFTQSTTTLQPIVCNQGVVVTEGGKVSAQFVAADARRMAVNSSTSMFNYLYTTGGSVTAVSRANDTAASKVIVSNKNSFSAAGIRLSRASDEAVISEVGRLDVAGVATAGNSINVTHSPGTTSQSVLAYLCDPDNATAGNRSRAWQNGSAMTNANSAAGTPFIEASQGNMTIGSDSAGSNPHDGTISEVLIWSSLIPDVSRDAYETVSGAFYGIAVT